MEATKRTLGWMPIFFTLFFFGIAGWLLSLTQPIVVPEPVAVPIAAINHEAEAVFPSDGVWSGGDPYLYYDNMTFETLPENAYCTPRRFSFDYRERLTFSCGWSLTEDSFQYGRAHVHLALPVVFGIWDWRFDRKNLTLQPVMMTWFGANFFQLLFAALFALAAAAVIGDVIDRHRNPWQF